MRLTHHANPLHKIERWTGTYFMPAALWEVGCYILVHHYNPQPVCESLQFQKDFLEQFERRKDTAEQVQLKESERISAGRDGQSSRPDDIEDIDMQDGEYEHPGPDYAAEVIQDNTFDEYLDNLYEQDNDVTEPSAVDGEADDTAEVTDADDDISHFPSYLSNGTGNDGGWQVSGDNETGRAIPRVDVLNNSYVRIVHANGIHHLAMITCNCHGTDCVPLDLVACGLMPASFQRIRTLFSAQVLDMFRLCNLELKASAYQFYQLLRRMTKPMAPAEVVDLYNEFRRMSRLWRWMKKLKWAGFGHNQKGAKNVGPAELANYCPACPQPGVNLPKNWKADPNRY